MVIIWNIWFIATLLKRVWHWFIDKGLWFKKFMIVKYEDLFIEQCICGSVIDQEIYDGWHVLNIKFSNLKHAIEPKNRKR